MIKDIVAPLPGLIEKILVIEGQKVSATECVVIMNSMKMDMNICADSDGVITKIHCEKGKHIGMNDVLVTITSE